MAEGRRRLVAVGEAPGRIGRARERLVPHGRRLAVPLLAVLLALSVLGWVMAQREAGRLESQLAATERTLAAAEARLAALESQRAALRTDIEALAGEASALAARLGELEARLAPDPEAAPTAERQGRADGPVPRSEP